MRAVLVAALAAMCGAEVPGRLKPAPQAGRYELAGFEGGERELPAGIVLVHSETVLAAGSEVRGGRGGTTLRMASDFRGRAVFVVAGGNVRLRDFTIDGNRSSLETRSGLPGSNVPFAQFTRGNGILIEHADGITIERVRFREMAGFAVLANGSRNVTIDRVRITDSGSRNAAGRNNTTGGILLEEGSSRFRVTHCDIRSVRGNGIWTHSLFTSPRNSDGVIALNRFDTLARDAIQVGHATRVRVEDNFGERIGYPFDEVDVETQAVPVAIDTAGDVDATVYSRNEFREVNGKCIDLDGFHDGDILENQCVNQSDGALYPNGNVGILFNDSNPHTRSKNIRVIGNVLDGVKYTGIWLFGTGHTVARNRVLNVNLAHSDGAGLQAGIYLGTGFLWPEPARGNAIESNEITGWKMKARCVESAPGVKADANRIIGNVCRDATSARP